MIYVPLDPSQELSRSQCLEILGFAGYTPAHFSITELHCLRRYVQEHVRLCECVADGEGQPRFACDLCSGSGWRKILECPLCHGETRIMAAPCRACRGQVAA